MDDNHSSIISYDFDRTILIDWAWSHFPKEFFRWVMWLYNAATVLIASVDFAHSLAEKILNHSEHLLRFVVASTQLPTLVKA